MKTMTCKQLGGACEMEFRAETFDEMAEQSRNHAHEMAEKGDKPHLAEMAKMEAMMKSDPESVKKWMGNKKKEFDELPEDH